MPDSAIPAATILLLRDEPAFEVLMIERHSDISFAGGAMVFPGGRIDEADTDPAWADYCDGLDVINAAEHTPRIAAIREAFEETGILYAREPGSQSLITNEQALAYDHLRNSVEDDAENFLSLIREANLRLACDALQLFARWMPPMGVHKRRFDTWFFAARTPEGQSAREDGNEATDVIWTTPAAVLEERKSGKRKMIFPTVRNVELLNLSESVDAVMTFAQGRKIERIQPKVIDRNGKMFVTIPDGLGYPTLEESVETAFRT